jgi:hypothetical protein
VSVNGDDVNGTGTLLSPYKTITKAFSVVGNTANTVVIHPGTYNESPTLSALNVTITAAAGGFPGGIFYVNGTMTIGNASSSTRLIGVRANSFSKTLGGSLYMDNCSNTGSFSNSGTGYIEILNSDLAGLSFLGGAQTSIVGGKQTGLTVNNASALVSVKNSLASAGVTNTIGTFASFDSVIYSLSPGTNAITTTANSSCTVQLFNSQIYSPTGLPERISLLGNFGYENCTFDRANSVITGTSLNLTGRFQNIETSGSTQLSGSISMPNLLADLTTTSCLVLKADKTIGLGVLGVAAHEDLPEIISTELSNLNTTNTGTPGTLVLGVCADPSSWYKGYYFAGDNSWPTNQGLYSYGQSKYGTLKYGATSTNNVPITPDVPSRLMPAFSALLDFKPQINTIPLAYGGLGGRATALNIRDVVSGSGEFEFLWYGYYGNTNLSPTMTLTGAGAVQVYRWLPNYTNNGNMYMEIYEGSSGGTLTTVTYAASRKWGIWNDFNNQLVHVRSKRNLVGGFDFQCRINGKTTWTTTRTTTSITNFVNAWNASTTINSWQIPQYSNFYAHSTILGSLDSMYSKLTQAIYPYNSVY